MYIVIPIRLPIATNMPNIFPIGADISNRVSAIALTTYINMHIITVKKKKIVGF